MSIRETINMSKVNNAFEDLTDLIHNKGVEFPIAHHTVVERWALNDEESRLLVIAYNSDGD